jgi:hypothetical protein
MTAATREGRNGLAAGLLGVPADRLDPEDVHTVGSLLALMSGVLMQWMLDPENAPTPENLTAGLHALSGRLMS